MEAAIREAIERPRMVRFWGVDQLCSPKVVDHVWGDGQKLAYLMPLNTRPNYYVLQMDSKWTSDDMWESGESGDELLEEALSEIGCQFGEITDEWAQELPDDDPELGWPVLRCDCGSEWGEYDDCAIAATASASDAPAQETGA